MSDRLLSANGPVEEGLWPQSRHARKWEVGLRHIICEASEQWYTT